ncbi:hypothetical protein [Bradyrhizobium sp. LA6.1]
MRSTTRSSISRRSCPRCSGRWVAPQSARWRRPATA